MIKLGDKIANLRKAKGISQEKLGELMGVSRQTVYKWETNAAVPASDRLAALSVILGCGTAYFYDEVEDSAQSVQYETAYASAVKKSRKALVIPLIITSVLLPFLVLVSVMFGFSAIVTDPGVIHTNTSGIDTSHFILVLIATVSDFIAVVVLTVLLILKDLKTKRYLKRRKTK